MKKAVPGLISCVFLVTAPSGVALILMTISLVTFSAPVSPEDPLFLGASLGTGVVSGTSSTSARSDGFDAVRLTSVRTLYVYSPWFLRFLLGIVCGKPQSSQYV